MKREIFLLAQSKAGLSFGGARGISSIRVFLPRSRCRFRISYGQRDLKNQYIYHHTNSCEEGSQVETSRSIFVYFRQLLYHIGRKVIMLKIAMNKNVISSVLI